MANSNDIITAPVSIADVKSVLNNSSNDLGTLCSDCNTSSSKIWYVGQSEIIITNMNPAVGDVCNIVGSTTTTCTIKSINDNGTITYKMNVQGEPEYTSKTVIYYNVLPLGGNIQVPLCFAKSKINKYSLKKPIWDAKDIYWAKYNDKTTYGINLVKNDLESFKELNVGLYLEPVVINEFSKVKGLLSGNNNFNFEYILFPKVYKNSTFRLTDFNDYNHNSTFPTFSLEAGTPNDKVFTRIFNADTNSYDSYPNSDAQINLSFTIPLRCTDTTLLNAIKRPLISYTNGYNSSDYPLKAAIVVYDEDYENQTYLTNDVVRVYYGNFNGDISCNVPNNNITVNTFFKNHKKFKWIFMLGADLNLGEGSSASNIVFPLKNVNIGGEIYGTTITRSTTISGSGIYYYKSNGQNLVSDTKKKLYDGSYNYYTLNAPEEHYSVYLENGAIVGYMVNSNTIYNYSENRSISVTNLGSVSNSSIRSNSVCCFFKITLNNYTGHSSSINIYIRVRIKEIDTNHNSQRVLSNDKIYKIKLGANIDEGLFGFILSTNTNSQSVLTYNNTCEITDLDTSIVGMSYSPTNSPENTIYIKYSKNYKDESKLNGYTYVLEYEITRQTYYEVPTGWGVSKQIRLEFSSASYMPNVECEI